MEKYIESLGFNNAFYNGKIAGYSILLWYNMFILAPVESRVERKRNQDPSHVFLRLVANFD